MKIKINCIFAKICTLENFPLYDINFYFIIYFLNYSNALITPNLPQVSSLHFWSYKIEMTLVASGCDQCVGSVGGGYTVHLIMKYPYSSCVCAFWQPRPYFLFNFCVN